ncbi:MAG: hypothetical protein VX948_01460 [Candidatus Latescibacterota bacterium]|nr:hypothetical protein [Candidatus Latescibacterota bacterium]
MAVGYAVSLLGDVHAAEDAAQEAFVTVFDRLEQLTDPFAFPASEVLRLALRDGETERIPVVKLCLDRNPNAAKPIHTNNLIYPASHRR